MDEVRKAVEDLIFYCEEAIERVKKSPVEDFTSGLPALSYDINRLVRTLHENKVLRSASEPFIVKWEYYEDTADERRSRSSDALSIWICDPTGNQATETGLWSHDWTHERKAEVRKRWWLTPDKTRELRDHFLNSTESWVRFLRHKKEQLGTASLAPAPEAPQEGEHLSETDLLKQHWPNDKGRETATKILRYMRQGLPQKDIAARVGLTKGTVSPYMKKLRELFPDLSPSLQSSETVRKTSRR